MKASALAACLFAAANAASNTQKTSITSIQKVLDMMEEMKAKGIAEKKDEAVKFSAFNQWCGDTTRVKNNEISAGNAKIDELNAAIEKHAAEIRKLTERIEELDEDNGRWAKDKESAAAVREKENIDFKATVLDYSESIDAVQGAITVLKKQAYTREQAGAALLQLQSRRLVPEEAKAALAAYLQQPSATYDESAMPNEMLFREAPEAAGYEFQSGGVVSMLEKLLDEFSSKKTELEKSELEAQHGYEQIAQQLTDNIETASQEISRKTKRRAETQDAKAEAEGDLASTTADRDEDQKYLDELTVLCQQKSDDFAARQELRAGEIEAISKAIEIIGSNTVAGAGDKHLPAASAASSFVQLRSAEVSPAQAKAANFLAEQAKSSGSRLLSEAAAQVSANPFVKVKKMIKDLIIKLQEEATAETEHKGWCDAELSANKIQRDERTSDVNQLTAEVEDLTAEIAQLTQDIADLAAAVQELDKAMAEQTDERTKAKATNEQTIQEAKDAQAAVKEAMAVLKEFYAKSATATALVQQSPMEDAPETFDKPYQGMLPEGGNIVDFLEVILSDFARLESETAASEETDQADYEKFMFESKKDKALKENESKHKSEKKTNKESALHSAQEELKANQDMLDKANAYYDKLKPPCVDSGANYADRVKAREAEMQSLKEALSILKGQDLPTLR